MIKAVTFDLDGTLIDSMDAIVDGFFHTFDVLGLPPPDRQAVVDSIGHLLEDQFALLTTHDPAECVRVYRAYYKTIACERTTALPGAAESLDRLQGAGLRLGFATSKKRSYAEMILAHLGLLDPFESRIGPHDVTHAKPHPEAVLRSLEALDAQPGEMFFVGDTDFDVLAAHRAGVECLCVTTGYNTCEQLAALEPAGIFDSLDELTDYILGRVEEGGEVRPAP